MSWVRLLRPFTLLPPLLGMLSGAAAAHGAGRAVVGAGTGVLLVTLGALVAALLNAASNVLNQIHDLQLDRINKPDRPLPRGEITTRQAALLCAALYTLSLVLAFLVLPTPVPEVGLIVGVTALLTWAYSAPPLRLRRLWWLAPLVIAVPRGGLLKVAGWATLAPTLSDREPWILGGIFFLLMLGAASTKDFGDMGGDRHGGVATLPLRFGPRGAALIMAPFYVLPWLLLATLPWMEVAGRPLLSVDPGAGTALSAALALHGGVTARLLVRHAEDLVDGRRGRAAWRNLYLLMMEAQVGLGVLYLAAPAA